MNLVILLWLVRDPEWSANPRLHLRWRGFEPGLPMLPDYHGEIELPLAGFKDGWDIALALAADPETAQRWQALADWIEERFGSADVRAEEVAGELFEISQAEQLHVTLMNPEDIE